MATSGRLLRNITCSRSLLKSLSGTPKCKNSSSLLKLVQGQNSISGSIQSRGVAQLLPCLALQASRKFAVGPINSSILDKCYIGKHTALTVAVNEAEVTSVEETDEDDEATLYILSEMFSMLNIVSGDG